MNPGGPPIIPMRLQPLPEFKPFEQPVIAHDKVRYVGEPIAVVLASSVAIGEDALEAIEVEIEDLPAVADWQTAAKNQSVLFEKPGTNRSLVFQARKGDADAAFANAPYVRREQLRTGRHYGLTMEPRGVMATWDDADGKLTIYGAAKVPFFNRRILSAQIGLPVEQIEMIENDVGGGYGARGEFYPEDFLIPFAARHVKRPVKWIEDRRENLMAMNHAREEECDLEVACARDGTILAIRGEVHTDMGAYMRTNGAVGARNVCAVHGRAVPRAARQDRLVAVDDQQDAGRHLSRAGPLRGLFLPRADDRHDRRRSRHRPHRVPPQEPDHQRTSSPIRSRMCSRPTPRTNTTAANTRETLDRALKEIDWPKMSKLQGKLIDGKYHGLGVVCFIEGGAAGPKEIGADRGQQGRHDVGLHGHVVGRAGRRDGVRADRRRRARSADRAHPSRLSRLDRLRERRLRRLSFALDGDGRLGGARRHQQFHGDACARPPASGSAAPSPTSRSTSTR